MLEFIKNKLLHLILPGAKSGKKDILSSEPNNSAYNDSSNMGMNTSEKIWKKEYSPLRQMVLWGWDERNNPAFLILYGRHHFQNSKGASRGRVLENTVKYTCYAIFKGKEGHLPSFEAVKIVEGSRYNRNISDTFRAMYYKKGLRYNYGWRVNEEYSVKEFVDIKPEQEIVLPYFASLSYDQYVQRIKNKKISFAGFKLAGNPREVLKLDGQYTEYGEIITDMMSHPSLYTRKKRLGELLAMNPPKDIYSLILEKGSTEVVSGLFLELAKGENPILVHEARSLMKSEIKWAAGSYVKGVKRCAKLYVNAIDPVLKAERTDWIRKHLTAVDLHLISINGRDFPPDEIIDGAAYRKYAASGLLKDVYGRYDYNKRQYVRYEAPGRYTPGPYTDGVKIKLIVLKNTIQEAEVYGLADVIGKIAYYLDSPRLTYYFKGSDKTKALRYFHRYIKRIINAYAEHNPDMFMETMKHLLTSYTPYDYVCKFPGNFQFNELLRYYLYHDFNEKPPAGWQNWAARFDWMANDQLLRLDGRHEYMKEIWDTHLDVVADIAIRSQIDQVTKACYSILKDSPRAHEFIGDMKYRQLMDLACAAYDPLAEMFMHILEDRVRRLNVFDTELMLEFIGRSDTKLHELAMDFFERTNGFLSPAVTADFLVLDNPGQWGELFRLNLLSLKEDQYARFIQYIMNNINKFLALDRVLPENIRDALAVSANEIRNISDGDKHKILSGWFAGLLHGSKVPEWLETYMQVMIFAFSYEELEGIMAEIPVEPVKRSVSSRNKRVITILHSIRNRTLPSDSQILDILDSGTPKMVNMLFDIISRNSEALNNRFATLLMMLEAEVTLLHQKAEEIFDKMPSERQKKLHAIILDSPVAKAYSFGLKKLDLIYRDLVPKEFIIQMLQHGSPEVKAYISDKIDRTIHHFEDGNEELFMYYLKTLLLLPNRISRSKDKVYEAIPRFVRMNKDKLEEIERLLLDIGGSNIIMDSERALVTLAKIRGEVMLLEG